MAHGAGEERCRHGEISKAHLIGPQIVEAGIHDCDSIRDWFTGPVDEGSLGQTNLYITAKSEFREVAFALISAKYKNGFRCSLSRGPGGGP
jgi:hypothetical protein